MFSVALKKPRALGEGDRIRLVAPASPFARMRFEKGLKIIHSMGFVPVVDRREHSRSGFLAGPDPKRAVRLENALLESDSQAVWCIRGGYGSARLHEHIHLDAVMNKPKLFLGFSDVTALLMPLSAPGGFVTIHGPVVTQLPAVPRSARDWLMRLITKPEPAGRVPLGKLKTLVGGRASGFLMGGNLHILASLVGTRHLPPLAGSILFIEDTSEPAYRLDRAFYQLKQSGVLENIFGVVIGGLSGCKPEGRGRNSARGVIERAVSKLGVPSVSGASFGHVSRNVALPLGLLANLDADKGSLTILESAVR